jgi:signal transduction histidine kinase
MDTPSAAVGEGLARRTILLVVLATVAATGFIQLLEHHVFMSMMNLPMAWYHVASGAVDAVTVCVIVVLYLTIRRDGLRVRTAYAQLRGSEALRQDLISMMVHDLRNPLASAVGALQVLQASRPSGEASARELEMVELALQSQQRLDGMIGDLLAIARAEEGKLELQKSEADLAQIAETCVAELGPVLKQHGLTVETNMEPARGVLDQASIRRVIENLLSNAARFTPRGGRVSVTTRTTGGKLHVLVADTGPGIAAEDRERVFDKFGQVEVHKTTGTSFGLGLTFCRYVVEAHGGRIWVEDAPGGGSLFQVELPA